MKHITFFLLFLLCAIVSSAQIIHVPGDHSTIQAAIDVAEEGDTVLVDEGRYYENLHFGSVPITLTSQFLIDGDTSHISKTIIDGSQYSDLTDASVIYIQDLLNSKAVLAGFTITGGAGTLSDGNCEGGGIYVTNCGCTIRNNIIEKNSTDGYGAGGSASQLNLGVSDTLYFFDNNVRYNDVQGESQSGGPIGIFSGKNCLIRFSGNIISNNISRSSGYYKILGGGMYIVTGYSYGNDIQIYNNIISHNELHMQSSHGGGIYVVYGRYDGGNTDPVTDTQVRIYNNLIYGNYSEDVGGGIAVWNMEYALGTLSNTQRPPIDPVIANNTIINNRAAAGSGIFNYDANTLLINNIIWNEVEGSEVTEIFNDNVDYCFPQDPSWCKSRNDGVLHFFNNVIRDGWEGFHNIDYEPMLDAETYKLTAGSSGIGMGIDSVQVDGTWYAAPSLDFNGNSRPNPVDNYVDIGAFESSFAYDPQFFLDSNGLTIKCICHVGDTGSVNDVVYEAVDRELLMQRLDGGLDAALLCTSPTVNMDSLFFESELNPDISSWDVSNVVSMQDLFNGAELFNADIGAWDVSKVIDMRSMFRYASAFNQDIGAWDVSNVTDMSSLFTGDTSFNQDIADWDVGKVTDMSNMFANAPDFNQDIGDWDVGHVTNMAEMFYRASAFNQDIGDWMVKRVTDMDLMFYDATAFNQDIGGWGVGSVTHMGGMFVRAEAFNQDIGSWKVNKVTVMSGMFQGAKAFNQDIGSWRVNNVTDMSEMFSGAEAFNQDLSGWCVEKIKDEPDLFAVECPLQADFYPKWGTCPFALSTNDFDNTGSINIYPNPVTASLYIETGITGQYHMQISSLNGQQLVSLILEDPIHQIDFSSFQKGFYFITIRTKDFVNTRKIVKL